MITPILKSTDADDTLHPTLLSEMIKTAVLQYFEELDGQEPGELFEMVMRQVEAPLLEVTMQQVDGNQTKAAQYLGINRGTLRKKLRAYGLAE